MSEARSERRQFNLAWAVAVALLAAGLVLGLNGERSFRAQAVRQAAVQADILAASVSGALAFDDRAAMQEYIGALRANPRVAAAAIYDAQGRQVARYVRKGAATPPVAAPATRGYRAGVVKAVAPVSEQGAQLGSVYVETAREKFTTLLARHSGLGLLTVMAFVLLGVLSRAAAQLQRRALALGEANDRLTVEIAERAKAEDALRQSQKMEALGQLTGGIAHDFNNLLQVIHGAFELIRRKPEDTAKIASWAANGLQASDRAASLTRQLLAFSRAQKLELRPFMVSELIEDMRELLVRTLGADIELVFELDREAVPVLSDRTQLELAVLNLAINARDAMPEGGRLTITTTIVQVPPGDPVLAADLYVQLAVADTGTGMPQDVADRAFDPFFTTKGVGKGTGLGLSQVYGVARQAGGSARIESEPGAGTTVKVLLRKSPVEAAATPVRAAGPGARPATTSATVLVVDDEPVVRHLVRDSLQELGYRVMTADSGPAAISLLDAAKPELILLDFAMPGMNGAEAAALIRRKLPETPIMVCSGYADTFQVEAALGGEAMILRKPFELQELADAVAEALKSPASA